LIIEKTKPGKKYFIYGSGKAVDSCQNQAKSGTLPNFGRKTQQQILRFMAKIGKLSDEHFLWSPMARALAGQPYHILSLQRLQCLCAGSNLAASGRVKPVQMLADRL
jgi:hypothetical protein